MECRTDAHYGHWYGKHDNTVLYHHNKVVRSSDNDHSHSVDINSEMNTVDTKIANKA